MREFSAEQISPPTSLSVPLGKEVLSKISKLKEYAGTSRVIPYTSALLNSIRRMIDVLEPDPFLQVFLALHNALAYDNEWLLRYTSDQYEGAHEIIKTVVNGPGLTQDKAIKAIMNLQTLGFIALPFEIDLDEDTDNPVEEIDNR